MNGALLYLSLASFAGSVRGRLRRLRQPKYAAALLVGVAYFYFFVFRHAFRARADDGTAAPAELMALLEPLAAAALLAVVAFAWLWGRDRAALRFTEAEVAFLFPAPVSRRTLIHYRLLRSQLRILVSAVLLALVFRRGALGAGAVVHAAGWWVVFSTLELHFLGASFARERLLDLGVKPARRRRLVGAALVLAVFGAWQGLREKVAGPTPAEVADLPAIAAYLGAVLGQPPVSWLLAPFRLVVAPYFAGGWVGLAAAMGPALLLLAAHYFWVVHSSVAFEEASLELAAKRAEQVAARREGRWRTGDGPRKPRPEPFRLAARGWVPVAFLWRNLISLGPLFRLRTWLMAAGAVVVAFGWVAADPARQQWLKVAGPFCLVAMVWTVLFGPMFMRRGVQSALSYLDVTRALPVAGWQVVVGELLTPALVITLLEWLFLLAAVLCAGAETDDPTAALLTGTGAAAALALLTPPLVSLMLCVPYAGVLYFPAWAGGMNQRGGGIEVMGQRLIFMAGYLIVLVAAIAPAVLLAGGTYLVAKWLAGSIAAAMAATVVAAVVLFTEVAGAVYWLGWKLEQFDLSAELPRS